MHAVHLPELRVVACGRVQIVGVAVIWGSYVHCGTISTYFHRNSIASFSSQILAKYNIDTTLVYVRCGTYLPRRTQPVSHGQTYVRRSLHHPFLHTSICFLPSLTSTLSAEGHIPRCLIRENTERVSALVMMRNGYFFLILLEVGATRSEALVAPRHCIAKKHTRVPSQQNRIVADNEHHGRTSGYSRKSSYSSMSIANGEDEEYDRVNEFQPRTMKVSESVAFFARFVVQTILDKRAQKSLGREHRRRLRDRLKRVAFVRKATKELVTTKKKKGAKGTKQTGIMGSMRKLNESRKSLIRLVGYDSSMVVPGENITTRATFLNFVTPMFN